MLQFAPFALAWEVCMRRAREERSSGCVGRRAFLQDLGAACVGLATTARGAAASPAGARVMTVRGPIAASVFVPALAHEHVFVDFVGADRVDPASYNLDEAFRVALPHLKKLKALGCRGFVDCTPAFLGRVPRLLARLSRATGLHILTSTGYYGAGRDRFVPAHAHEDSVEALADRWTAEWRVGIGGTGIKPGFIKTGVDAAPLSAIDRKLLRAGARTHLRTGLTVASHTLDTRGAREQLDILREEGVAPDAFIWVHAQNDWRTDARIEAAREGAWVEIDNVSSATVPQCVEHATELKQAGVLKRLLVSHDAGWYDPALAGGGRFRPFDAIHTTLVPALRRAGWSASELRELLTENPAAAFTVRVRRRVGVA
jgi:phosphotriesterase-related protein